MSIVDSSGVSFKGDEEGRRIMTVEINGEIHTHVIKPRMQDCEKCRSNSRVYQIFLLAIDRSRQGL